MEIRLGGFSFRYIASQPRVISDITIAVASGSCCAVLGPTGAGKTTFLSAIAGVLGAHHSAGVGQGEITIGKTNFRPMPQKILFPLVGLTLQESQVMISGLRETVGDEIRFTLENIGLDSLQHEERVEHVMESLGIQHLRERKPTTLSGGELQRVVLASLLVAQPAVLLLDEPINSLDAEATHRLIRILRSLHGSTTVLFTDCQVELAILAADSVLVLEEGRKVFFGDKRSFLTSLPQLGHLLPTKNWQDVLHRLSKAKSIQSERLARVVGIS